MHLNTNLATINTNTTANTTAITSLTSNKFGTNTLTTSPNSIGSGIYVVSNLSTAISGLTSSYGMLLCYSTGAYVKQEWITDYTIQSRYYRNGAWSTWG